MRAAANAGGRRENEEPILSIMSSLSEFFRSLTSGKANTDVPTGVDVPPSEDGAVPRPDREPMAGFEGEREK